MNRLLIPESANRNGSVLIMDDAELALMLHSMTIAHGCYDCKFFNIPNSGETCMECSNGSNWKAHEFEYQCRTCVHCTGNIMREVCHECNRDNYKYLRRKA